MIAEYEVEIRIISKRLDDEFNKEEVYKDVTTALVMRRQTIADFVTQLKSLIA